MTDYYQVLHVPKNAKEEDIKKSYRKLAKVYHPDVTKLPKEEAEIEFKKLAEAYSVLSNKEQRERYDKLGHEGFKNCSNGGGGFGGEFDASEIFNSLFGVGGGGGGGSDVPDITEQIEVSLEQLYSGTTLEHEIVRATICKKCRGFGTKTGKKMNCGKCKGQGMAIIRMGPMISQTICPSCSGSGMDPRADKCVECQGETLVRETLKIQVVIPRGAHSKQPVIVENEGNEIPADEKKNGVDRSNVVFIIGEKPHPIFKRNIQICEGAKVNRADLLLELNITFAESIMGFCKQITHLDGGNFSVQLLEPSRHGDIIIARCKGLPRLEGSVGGGIGGCGDLFIKLIVEHPRDLSEKATIKLCKLFNSYQVEPNEDAVEVVHFENYKVEKKEAYEEEDMKEKYMRRKMGGGGETGGQECRVQ